MAEETSCNIQCTRRAFGFLLLIAVGITLSGATISIFIGIIHCARAAAATTGAASTRRASVALALPIPLKPEDHTSLPAKPEHPVPMLSVQTAGYAGMERLGVPTRTTLNAPPDDRAQFSRRIRADVRELQTVIRSNNHSNISNSNISSTSGNNSSNNYHHHHQHHHHHHLHHHHQRMSVTAAASATAGSGCALVGSNSINNGSIANNTQATAGVAVAAMTINSNNSNIARVGVAAPATATLKYGKSVGSASGSGSSGHNSLSCSSCASSNASSMISHSHDHHQHYQHQLQQQRTLRCPHHVPLPDSEWGQDRDLQIRTRYQQSEITRSYIKPPPNKSIKDVPEHASYNFHALTPHAASAASVPATATFSQLHYASAQQQQQHNSSYNQNFSSSSATSSSTLLAATAGSSNQQQQQQQKSKPNVITKLFSRKSSPKSPTALSSNSSSSNLASSASFSSMPFAAASATSLASSASSCASTTSSVSASSSASSLSSAQSLPISTASTLTTTPCSYGSSQAMSANNILAGLAPTTQLLTTIGVSGSTAATSSSPPLVRIPSPPMSVSVPIMYQQHRNQQTNQAARSSSNSSVADANVMDCAQLTAAVSRQPSLSPSASRARTPNGQQLLGTNNELPSMLNGSNISRNSSNCSMESYNCCSCGNSSSGVAAATSCNCVNGRETSQQQHQRQQTPEAQRIYDHQHVL